MTTAAGSTALRGEVVLGGKYELLKPIGKGKFAVVYRARRLEDGSVAALKKIGVDSMDQKTRSKCLKEVRLLQSLEHPNIVRYLDSLVEENDLLIAFEWAAAGDLKRQIRKTIERSGCFEERVIWKYFAQICEALVHMHERRILHRDLKPANVFLQLDGTVKVGDLGLGRMMSEHTLEAHSKVGTPLYMSPEVLRGDGYDWKSDVWSLGCILYELAALKSPFKAEGLDLYGLFQKISKADFKPLPETYSPNLRDLAHTMLRVQPTDRPDCATARDVAARMRTLTTTTTTTKLANPRRIEQQRRSTPPPDHVVLVQSESIVEKLTLLNYPDCRRKDGLPPLTRTHFFLQGCGRGLSQHTQFTDVAHAAAFVLAKRGADVKFFDHIDEAPVRAATGLLAAARADYSGPAAPHDLVRGFGAAVCEVLGALLDAALANFTLQPPDFSRLGNHDDDSVVEQLSSDDEDRVLDDAVVVFDDDDDEHHRRDSRDRTELPLEPTVDASEWLRELERVGHRLCRVVPSRDHWSARLEACRGHLGRILQDFAPTLRLGRQLGEAATSIARGEAALASRYAASAEVYAAAARQRHDLDETAEAAARRLADRTSDLDDLQERLDAINADIREQTAARADPSRLVATRRALADLKTEITRLDLVLGIARHNVWTAERRRGRDTWCLDHR